MKVLVTGAAGQLGGALLDTLRRSDDEAIAVQLADFDLTDADAVRGYVRAAQPEAIIHCAAYTNVDKAETEPEKCITVNAMGTLNMVRAALEVDASLTLISSDYVFPGTGEAPWRVDDAPRPLNIYGLSKLQAEDAVRSLMTRYFIVRTSWLYSTRGNNFIKAILHEARGKQEIPVVADQIGAPTSAVDLAALLLRMIHTDRYGTYHAVNSGFCSRAELARFALAQTGSACRVREIATPDYPARARRPLNSRLDTACLTENGFDLLPDWRSSVAAMLAASHLLA